MKTLDPKYIISFRSISSHLRFSACIHFTLSKVGKNNEIDAEYMIFNKYYRESIIFFTLVRGQDERL